mgnify:CR=1 FL=1
MRDAPRMDLSITISVDDYGQEEVDSLDSEDLEYFDDLYKIDLCKYKDDIREHPIDKTRILRELCPHCVKPIEDSCSVCQTARCHFCFKRSGSRAFAFTKWGCFKCNNFKPEGAYHFL